MDVTLSLRGDQIGTFSAISGNGNGSERVVTVEGVQALGPRSEIYTVLVEQVSAGVSEFQNGQFVTIFDSAGNIVMPRTGINPDEEQGMAAGDEHLIISATSFVIDLGGLPVGPETVFYSQADQANSSAQGDNDGNLDFTDFPCLDAGTIIETTRGRIRAEELRQGDMVRTYIHESCMVNWVGMRTVPLENVRLEKKPISLHFESLGASMMGRNLIVSPQHRILLSGPEVEGIFGVSQVLAPAKGLLNLPGVRAMRGKAKITYVSILLERHSVMMADGVWVESFFPGPEGMRRLTFEQQRKVELAIPGLRRKGVIAYGPPAERLLKVQETRMLVQSLNRGRVMPRGFVFLNQMHDLAKSDCFA